ncbi:hypothetical protein MP638_007255 [Amoeboaphelidium occidentale]|nr:hypothetical protein MP638_007255 [Amoeboaphelidium occidentale]
MVKRITTIIPKSKHITIVFDGGSTEEKQVTHIKRLESKRQSVQALQYFVDSLCKGNGDQEGAEDIVSLKRVSKAKKILMKQLIKKAFVLTKQDKKEIMALLKRLGYTIEQAAGEADVFIGTRKGRVNVISPDSDMVFHLNDGIWAVPSLQGNNLMIRYIDVAEARNKLKLNLASLRALAVLGGNDYCSNVRGWAIASVYKRIRQYRKADLESCNKLVQSFLETVGSDSNFDKALMIFECKEEHVLPHDARTEILLQLSLYNKESEKFNDDNESLTRYKYKTVDRKSLCVSEVPPLTLKNRPKQPEEILESQIEALQENLYGSESNEENDINKLQKLCKSKVEYFYKLNQLLPSNKRWSMISLSRVPDLAITVNESGLLDVLKQVVPVFKRISNDFVIQNKGWFFMELFGKNFGDNRNRHLRLQNDTSNKRYILQNTLQTGGVELRVHVLDTAEKKKRNVLQPTQEIDFDEELFDNAGVKPSDVVYDKVPIMTEDEAKDCYFVGVDLGYKYSAGVCAVQESSNTIRNLAIRKNFLREPFKKYNRWFYKQKNENEWVYETERLMERTESETASNFATRWFNCYSKLYVFYNSLSMKKNRWDLKKALRGELDRAVHAILRMVEMKINFNLKHEAFKNKRTVIGIGASKFEMGDNTHTLFEKHLVMKLRSLGYTVVCVEEYLTGQMCRRCFNRTEQLKMRVKYCRHCHVFYHRDVMAGENMARVLRDEVTGKGRPEHLRYKPPNKPSPDYSASIGDEIGDKTLDDSAEDNVSVSLVKKGKRRLDMSH